MRLIRTQSAEHLHDLVTDRLRVKHRRRLHRRKCHQLHQVVLDHVAQSPRPVIIFPAILHAKCFRGTDLDRVDIITIPQWFEYAVGETEHQDVLHRLFPQIMVDTVNFLLIEDMDEMLVQTFGRFEARSERLLHDHAAPTVLASGNIHPVFFQAGRDQLVHHRRRGKIIDDLVRQLLLLP